MGEMSFLICGAIIGAAAIGFFVLLMNIRTEFTEIKWHSAVQEDPSDYKTGTGIEVLVRMSSGRIVVTSYFPDVQTYAATFNCYPNETITHWAYAVEVGNTIPKYIHTSYSDRHAI